MNANDWVQMAGHPLAGRGGRPINPKIAPYLVAKARPAKSTASARQARRMILQAARLTGEVDNLLSPTGSRRSARAATRSPSLLEQSQPGPAGAAARMRHNAIVQRWRKAF
jgi:hypothetical protein